jgi:hypothetical protein
MPPQISQADLLERTQSPDTTGPKVGQKLSLNEFLGQQPSTTPQAAPNQVGQKLSLEEFLGSAPGPQGSTTSGLSAAGGDPSINRVGAAFNNFSRSFLELFAGVPEGVGAMAAGLNRFFGGVEKDEQGNPKLRAEQFATYQMGQDLRDFARKHFPNNPDFEDEFVTTTLTEGAGSLVGFFASGAAGPGGPLLLGSISGGAEQFQDAKRHGASEEDAFEAFVKTLPIGATEAIPVGRALGRINRVFKGELVPTLTKKVFQGGLEEAIQETAQTFLTNAVAKDVFDAERELFQGAGEGGAAGFILGAAANALGLSLARKNRIGDIDYFQEVEDIQTFGRQTAELLDRSRSLSEQQQQEIDGINAAINEIQQGLGPFAQFDEDARADMIALQETRREDILRSATPKSDTNYGQTLRRQEADLASTPVDEANDIDKVTYNRPSRIGNLRQKVGSPEFAIWREVEKGAIGTAPLDMSGTVIEAQQKMQHNEADYEVWWKALLGGSPVIGRIRKTRLSKKERMLSGKVLQIISDLRNPLINVSGQKARDLRTELADIYKKHPNLEQIVVGRDGKGGLFDLFEHVKTRMQDSLQESFIVDLDPAINQAFRAVAIERSSTVPAAVDAFVDTESMARAEFIKAQTSSKKKKPLTEQEAIDKWNRGGKVVERKKKRVFDREKKKVQAAVDEYDEIGRWGLEDFYTRIELGNYKVVDADGKTHAIARNLKKAKVKAKAINNTRKANGLDPIAFEVEVSPARVNPTIERRNVLAGEQDIFEVLPRYLHAMEKRIVMTPIIRRFKKESKENPNDYRDDVKAVIQDQINEVMGANYSFGERVADDISAAFGWELGRLGSYVGVARNLTANLKLAYRPVGAFINAFGGFGHTWVKVGSDISARAARGIRVKPGSDDWIYTSPQGDEVNMDDLLLEGEKNGRLGIDFAVDASGKIDTRVPIWKPLGLFTAPEKRVRRHNYAANYIYHREIGGLGHPEAATAAARSLRFQEFAYNTAAISKLLRSPVGKLVGQFKTYMVKEIEFVSTLRKWEWARYLGLQLAIAGPRGIVYTLKSLPIFFALGMGGLLDDIEKWFAEDKEDPIPNVLLRGVFGAVGGDASPAAALQFPRRPEDWMGPFLSDAYKLMRDVVAPGGAAVAGMLRDKEGPIFIKDRAIDWVAGLSPMMYYMDQLDQTVQVWDPFWRRVKNGKLEEAINTGLPEAGDNLFSKKWAEPNVWVRDSQGNLAYPVGGLWDRMLIASGISPVQKTNIEVLERTWKEAQRIRSDNRKRYWDKVVKQIVLGRELPKDLLQDAAVYSIDIDTVLKMRTKIASMTPRERNLLRAEMLKKAEALDHFIIPQ